MREQIINGINALSLGTFTVSSELPWDSSGQPLYLKNLKVFYVDEPQYTTEQLVATLDASVFIGREVTTIRVYVACDAKTKPSNYDSLKAAIRGLRTLTSTENVTSKECDVITSFEADTLVTEFEFRFGGPLFDN